MKKTLRNVLATGMFALALGLASCGGVSQKYADKINAAAATSDADDDYTYDKVLKDLGDPAVNGVVELFGSGKTGVCTWYKGYKTVDEFNAAIEDGKTVKTIVVTFAGGKAANAAYTEAKKDSE